MHFNLYLAGKVCYNLDNKTGGAKLPVLVRGTAQMKQGETGMSFRHAPGKFLVIGRFLEKIVSALLPFLTMLVSARFIDLV